MRTIKTYFKGAPFYNAFVRSWPLRRGDWFIPVGRPPCTCNIEHILRLSTNSLSPPPATFWKMAVNCSGFASWQKAAKLSYKLRKKARPVSALSYRLFLRDSSRGDLKLSFRTRATAIAFFALALVSTAHAQTQAPAQTSTQATALPPDNQLNALREAAAAGDAQAQFALADDYFGGVGVAQDYGQAVIWYRKSAAQGYAPALNQLGYMQENKIGLPRDYKRALYYYRLAANKGNALAEYNLGAMFKAGLSVKRDYKQAFDWYRKAADQNLSEAEEEIGYFYQWGWGVKRDYAQALAWYRRAAGDGDSDAENQLGYMAEQGLGQSQNYAEAFSWYYKSADHGNDEAMENIGYDFEHGIGVAVDYAKAMTWLYQAAALENSDAENQLGWIYQYGQGVKPNDANAEAWYQLSADQGNVRGQNNLSALQEELDEDGGGESANEPVNDPAIEIVQRRARIRDLRAQITGLETDALAEDNSADELAHMGNNGKKNGSIAKVMDAFGTVVSEKPRLDASQLREQAASLRVELARLESLDKSSANVLVP